MKCCRWSNLMAVVITYLPQLLTSWSQTPAPTLSLLHFSGQHQAIYLPRDWKDFRFRSKEMWWVFLSHLKASVLSVGQMFFVLYSVKDWGWLQLCLGQEEEQQGMGDTENTQGPHHGIGGLRGWGRGRVSECGLLENVCCGLLKHCSTNNLFFLPLCYL